MTLKNFYYPMDDTCGSSSCLNMYTEIRKVYGFDLLSIKLFVCMYKVCVLHKVMPYRFPLYILCMIKPVSGSNCERTRKLLDVQCTYFVYYSYIHLLSMSRFIVWPDYLNSIEIWSYSHSWRNILKINYIQMNF